MYSRKDGPRTRRTGNRTFGDDSVRLVLGVHASRLQLVRQDRTLPFIEPPPFLVTEVVRIEVAFNADSERDASGALVLALILRIPVMSLDEWK